MSPTVSVITVSYHTGPTLWITIASALRQPECKEVIIVNNGNMKGVENRLRKLAEEEPRIKLLSGHGNVGFGKGNNLGVAAATGDYVLLLNPDSMLPEGGLAAMLAEMQRYPANTLAGCYLINPDGSEQRGGRRALLNPRNAIAESLGLNRFIKSSEQLNYNKLPMPKETHEIPAISGAFMFLTKAFYEQLQGFDEDYFLHMEDMDFCYRVHKADGKVICVPAVKVLHFRSTSEVTSAFIEKHKARGFIRYMHKFFASEYSQNSMKLIEAGIWLRLWLKIIIGKIDRLFVPPLQGKYEIARLALLYDLTRFHGTNDSLAGKTILVTGGTSQIGLSIIGKALSRGAKVIAYYYKSKVVFSHPNLQWKYANLSRAENIAQLVSQKADIFFHAAELTLLPAIIKALPDDSFKRVIAFSSDFVHNEKFTRNPYEKKRIATLKAAESNVSSAGQEHKRDITILRPFMPYGIGFDRSITHIADVIKRHGITVIYKDGNGLRSPVQTKEVAEAALAIADNAKTYGKTYDLGGTETFSYSDMILYLADYIGKPVKPIRIPMLPLLLDLLGKIYHSHHINSEMAFRMNRDLLPADNHASEDFNFHADIFLTGDVTL